MRHLSRALAAAALFALAACGSTAPHPPPDAGPVLPPGSVTLTLIRSGDGTVTSSFGGLNCGQNCTITVAPGTSLTLTATPELGSSFAGWSGGGCSGLGPFCELTMNSSTTVNAAFDTGGYTLTVVRTGNGTGTVTSAPQGIHCGATCASAWPEGTSVTLSATASTGSTFMGWTGDCTGQQPCTVELTADAQVQAVFALNNSVVVTRAGNGDGLVVSTPAGINCGPTCSRTFELGQVLTLSATAIGDAVFTGWSGACAGVADCALVIDQPRLVTATFTLNRHALVVSRNGNGSGTVHSTPAGILCGTGCTSEFDSGTVVTLSAQADPGSVLTGWSAQECPGVGDCVLSVTAPRGVTATFTRLKYPLTVLSSGAGSGVVSSTPAGISCGSACTASFDHGTQVTLTAAANPGSSFTGWSGACTGTGTCQLTVTGAETVSAHYDTVQLVLTAVVAGVGTITSSPGGISCGGDCTEAYDYGTQVTLTATPGQGLAFNGWSGACSGAGNCVLSMTEDRTVTATFACSGSLTFNFTGSAQTFSLPSCISTVANVTVLALGGQGGRAHYNSPLLQGGLGGRTVATLAVAPMDVLHVYVGGAGGDASGGNSAGAGGFNGGTSGGSDGNNQAGGGGGGASDVRRNGTALTDRVVVAGGGGGAASCSGSGYGGGGGGGLSGGNPPTTCGSPAAYATGGSQSAGGQGGSYSGYCSAMAGTLGNGAPGCSPSGGGGGGGGLFGGGGGAWMGGGGGSGFAHSSASGVTHTVGVHSGPGQVTLTW